MLHCLQFDKLFGSISPLRHHNHLQFQTLKLLFIIITHNHKDITTVNNNLIRICYFLSRIGIYIKLSYKKYKNIRLMLLNEPSELKVANAYSIVVYSINTKLYRTNQLINLLNL